MFLVFLLKLFYTHAIPSLNLAPSPENNLHFPATSSPSTTSSLLLPGLPCQNVRRPGCLTLGFLSFLWRWSNSQWNDPGQVTPSKTSCRFIWFLCFLCFASFVSKLFLSCFDSVWLVLFFYLVALCIMCTLVLPITTLLQFILFDSFCTKYVNCHSCTMPVLYSLQFRAWITVKCHINGRTSVHRYATYFRCVPLLKKLNLTPHVLFCLYY